MRAKEYLIGSYEKAFPEELSLKQMLDVSAECGFDFFEISIDRTDERINRLYNCRFQENLVTVLRKSPIKIGSICLSALGTYTLGNPDIKNREKAIDIFKHAVLFAEKLGIRIIQIPGCDVPKFQVCTIESDRLFLDNLKSLIDFAAAHGVLIAIENMENCYMDTIEKNMRVINSVNSPYLHLYPDSGNITSAIMLYNGDIQNDMLCGAGHYVAFHLKETLPNKYGGLFYGEGHVNFELIIGYAWQLGVRRFVMEYWVLENRDWKQDLLEACNLCKRWIEKTIK